MADKGHHHVDQPIGRLATSHDICGENKHGNRYQGSRANAGEHLLDKEIHAVETVEHHHEADHCADNQRYHHRKPEQQKHQHDEKHDPGHHPSDLRFLFVVTIEHSGGQIHVPGENILYPGHEVLNACDGEPHRHP